MRLLWKRHYPIALILIGILAGLGIFFGKARVIAYTTRVQSSGSESTGCITNSIDLMDDAVVHSVLVNISAEDLKTMLSTYRETGEKDYFHADVVLDGVTVSNVGIRLKGNASLRSASGGMGGGGGGGMPGNNNRPNQGGMQPNQAPNQGQNQAATPVPNQNGFPTKSTTPAANPNTNPQPGGNANPGAGFAPPNGMPQMLPGQDANAVPAQNNQAAGGTSTKTNSDLTTMNVPYKIKFDEFEKDQCYQGLSEINIRTSGTATDAAMLQEPLTNAMMRLAGIPATRTVFTGFSINGSAEKLLVISELVNEEYLEANVSNPDGILYKAEMGSSLDYKGDDPSSYSKSFTQETRKKEADLAPLIEFTRFLTDSSDTDFDARLADWLDVDSFATYLAVNNLLVNRDSMADMNNNYYLYYDDTVDKFTVLMWDANESMGKLGGGNQSANYDLYYSRNQQTNRMPGGGKNILVQRFFASAKFKALYEEKLIDAYRKIFLSGAVDEQLAKYANLIRSASAGRSLVTLESYNAAVTKDQNFLAQRLEYLKSTDLLADLH